MLVSAVVAHVPEIDFAAYLLELNVRSAGRIVPVLG